MWNIFVLVKTSYHVILLYIFLRKKNYVFSVLGSRNVLFTIIILFQNNTHAKFQLDHKFWYETTVIACWQKTHRCRIKHIYANRNSLITVITYCVLFIWKSKTPSDRFAIIVGIHVNSSRFQRTQTKPSHNKTTVRPWPIWQRLIIYKL